MPSRNPRALPPGLDPKGVPDHVAIVMDGNGRWAGAKGLPRNKGHEAGEAALFDTVEGGLDAGLSWLTVYAFSTENWRRPASEVRFLMNFNESLLVRRSHELHEREVRIRFIGRRDRIPPHVRRRIEEAEDLTAGDTRMTLAVALDYGGRDELARAVQALAAEVREGRGPRRIDERAIARHLYAPDMPDVDLLIRTSNEYRISNFLLWQIAYAELHFTPVLWPDFNRHELFEALRVYQGRHRRFGAVADPTPDARRSRPDPAHAGRTRSDPGRSARHPVPRRVPRWGSVADCRSWVGRLSTAPLPGRVGRRGLSPVAAVTGRPARDPPGRPGDLARLGPLYEQAGFGARLAGVVGFARARLDGEVVVAEAGGELVGVAAGAVGGRGRGHRVGRGRGGGPGAPAGRAGWGPHRGDRRVPGGAGAWPPCCCTPPPSAGRSTSGSASSPRPPTSPSAAPPCPAAPGRRWSGRAGRPTWRRCWPSTGPRPARTGGAC